MQSTLSQNETHRPVCVSQYIEDRTLISPSLGTSSFQAGMDADKLMFGSGFKVVTVKSWNDTTGISYEYILPKDIHYRTHHSLNKFGMRSIMKRAGEPHNNIVGKFRPSFGVPLPVPHTLTTAVECLEGN